MRLLPILVCLLLAGCAARPASAWQPERAAAVAWWIEDVAHGLPRDPGEIRPVDGGPRDEAIARWAAAAEIGGTWQPPRQLAQRRARWPAVAVAISQGEAVPLAEAGLLAPAEGLPTDRFAEVTRLLDAENNDRRFIDGLVLVMGAADAEVEGVYRAAVRQARAQHGKVPVAGGPDAR